jgi:hypothetical protein
MDERNELSPVEDPAIRPPEEIGDAQAYDSLIYWMLGLTPEQRLAVLQEYVDAVWELKARGETYDSLVIDRTLLKQPPDENR